MTEKHSELSTKLVVGHKRDGRNIYSEQAKQELIAACLQPGVSVAGMALRHGVNANLLRNWVTKYQTKLKRGISGQAGQEPQAVAAKLLPVVEVNVPKVERSAKAVGTGKATSSCIEIVMLELTVRVCGEVDSRQLAMVLDLARRQ